MLKLTNAFADKAIFVRPGDVMSVQQTDDCTLVFLSKDVVHEVKEEAEAIVRYLVSKSDWDGNDKYDTINVRNINRDNTLSDFDDICDLLDYAYLYLKKQIQEGEEKIKKGENVYEGTLKRYKELMESHGKFSKNLVSLTVREIE